MFDKLDVVRHGQRRAYITSYISLHLQTRLVSLTTATDHELSTMSTDASGPSADDKARYEAAKKELAQAISKKRLVDRQLVHLFLWHASATLTEVRTLGSTRDPDLQA